MAQFAHTVTLQEGQNLEGQLFQLRVFDVVRFIPGSSLFKYDIINIYTNYTSGPFVRQSYQKIDGDLNIQAAGSFHYYFTAGNERLGSGYLLVLPTLSVPLDRIRCQTVITKQLGTFDAWRSRLEVSYRSGYNMIHFTPLQELGGSQSAYSIRDQNKLNPNLFKSSTNILGVGEFIRDMNKQWKGMLSITDIVLNHTSNDSPWLVQHPECAYNCLNSPHLRPAFLVDRAIHSLSLDLASKKWLKTHGLGNCIANENDLSLVGVLLRTLYLSNLRLHQFYQIDIPEVVKQFRQWLDKNPLPPYEDHDLVVVQDPLYRRLKSLVDIRRTAAFVHLKLKEKFPSFVPSEDPSMWMDECVMILIQLTEEKNRQIHREVSGHLAAATSNVLSAVRYERLDSNGPRVPLVTRETPLVPCYFKTSVERVSAKQDEQVAYDANSSEFIWAHNGWVMNANPVDDFASPTSNIYLRRELIAWGDSVKLRFGQQPSDCPYVWRRMRDYVVAQAKAFHGFRLDNCHSTPLHVAEHMLDAARAVNRDLYVVGELFTANERIDNLYVNRLGISALVREAMSAHTARDLGAQIYRFGGEAIGAYFGSWRHLTRPLRPRVAPAIFYDATHDNESPIVRKSVWDLQATSAIVSMAACSAGSTRGYDELVPHHISVVSETRLYPPWNSITDETGIIPLRCLISELQNELVDHDELFVDQVDDNVIAITRHHPENCTSIVVVARTAFHSIDDPDQVGTPIRSLRVPGELRRVLFEAKMCGDPSGFERDEHFINGLGDRFRTLITNSGANCQLVNIKSNSNIETIVEFSKFVPGSVIAFEIGPNTEQVLAIEQISQWARDTTNLEQVIKRLTLADINYVLFRCSSEPASAQFDDFVYELPGAPLVYSGLAGIEFLLRHVRKHQDQAHPLSANLRDGHWLADFTCNRLMVRPGACSELGDQLRQIFDQLRCLPRALKPKFFDLIIRTTYEICVEHALGSMSTFVQDGIAPLRTLALGSLALVGPSCDALLSPLAPTLNTDSRDQVSIAAGLPHFASGYMRMWGRDTFISMRGLLLLTGRYREARNIILSFAGAMRHGLIPNLLDGGHRARFNCRDAIWWWLYCIKEYSERAPDGAKILELPVYRLFPNDRLQDEHIEQPLHAVIQESLEAHARGIDFVEINAGEKLDAHMQPEGFRVCARIDSDTGFVCGGNSNNCGTWMDKMGSSDEANIRGTPATPRDGAAVELVGLSYACISWLEKCHADGLYTHDGLAFHNWSWSQWRQKIEENFHDRFYVEGATIYRDTVGSSTPLADEQFRPNFLVAMSVAPKLFDRKCASHALELVKARLVGPLGMRTLDPADPQYNGNYDNNDHTHGFNYHQGPEWLWLTGYYIMSVIKHNKNSANIEHIKELLANHIYVCEESAWFGLPELTNANGAPCHASCATQAWSLGTIIEAVHELSAI